MSKNKTKEMEIKEEYLHEKAAAEFLGIPLKSLRNRVYEGKMDGMFIVAALNRRMYMKSKLLGLEPVK